MNKDKSTKLDEIALENFVKYLQFATVHPNPNYGPAVEWLLSKGRELNLDCFLMEYVENNPIVVMRWTGSNPELGAILLNSHMDVVPVVEEKWNYPPFGATIVDGKIYARGSQDMKCVGIQQLESIRRIKAQGISQLERTIYLSFVPDEEVGGFKGMKLFVSGAKPLSPDQSICFKDMNVEFCLDEGIASPEQEYVAFYNERRPCWVKVNFHGNAGHGLAFIENTAAEKLNIFLNHILLFRKSEQTRLEDSKGELSLGDVTTVNITMLDGGLQYNIVPETLSVICDVRLTPSLSLDSWKKQLDCWAHDAGGNIDFEFINIGVDLKDSVKHPDENPSKWLTTLESLCMKLGIVLKKRIFPGATDARYVRQFHLLNQYSGCKQIQAIGFSPIKNTPILLHDHDEFLGQDEFLYGCQFYVDLVKSFGNLI